MPLRLLLVWEPHFENHSPTQHGTELSLLLFFRERRREREGEKHHCVVASRVPPTGDLARNTDMCPDWGLIQRPFGSHAVLNSLSYTSQGKDFIF